jgi:hypothetical protein
MAECYCSRDLRGNGIHALARESPKKIGAAPSGGRTAPLSLTNLYVLFYLRS